MALQSQFCQLSVDPKGGATEYCYARMRDLAECCVGLRGAHARCTIGSYRTFVETQDKHFLILLQFLNVFGQLFSIFSLLQQFC